MTIYIFKKMDGHAYGVPICLFFYFVWNGVKAARMKRVTFNNAFDR